MRDSQSSYLSSLSDFMSGIGWVGSKCASCAKTFFRKPSPSLRSVCGRNKCNEGISDFRKLPGRKSLVTPFKILETMRNHFASHGYNIESPVHISSLHGKTDLVVAGVQMYDGVIHGNAPEREGKYFIAQPSIRTQFIPFVGIHGGTSTSFVNVCTEKMGATFEEHLGTIDLWCSILSGLGLHMNDFTLVVKESKNNWGTGEFDGFDVFFQYGDLELGDASYITVPVLDKDAVVISDVGFGLERIAWAMNKTDSYYDLLAPISILGNRVEVDACRTLSLLALSGITASNRGAGQQFRKFAKILTDAGTQEVRTLVHYFYEYWSRFVENHVSLNDAAYSVRIEQDRVMNARVCELLGLPPPKTETTEAYFERLVYTCGISHQDLRKAIQSCKK